MKPAIEIAIFELLDAVNDVELFEDKDLYIFRVQQAAKILEDTIRASAEY